jgi:hypothetical protein
MTLLPVILHPWMMRSGWCVPRSKSPLEVSSHKWWMIRPLIFSSFSQSPWFSGTFYIVCPDIRGLLLYKGQFVSKDAKLMFLQIYCFEINFQCICLKVLKSVFTSTSFDTHKFQIVENLFDPCNMLCEFCLYLFQELKKIEFEKSIKSFQCNVRYYILSSGMEI